MEKERLSEEAYERKKAYNREYGKKYRKDNNLTNFHVEVEKNICSKIDNLIIRSGMSRKYFLEWTYNLLEANNGKK